LLLLCCYCCCCWRPFRSTLPTRLNGRKKKEGNNLALRFALLSL
jgi:hypothetical protein